MCLGGYSILKADSLDEVLAMVKDAPRGEQGGGIEIRRIMDLEDLPEGMRTEEVVNQAKKMRELMGRNLKASQEEVAGK